MKVFETTAEAEQAWTDIILSTWRDNSAFMAACTPSRLNFEGDPTMLNPRSGAYGGGYGDFFGYQDLLAEWRAKGDFEGFALEHGRRPRGGSVVSVTVVTGGAVGIGAAIAEELGRAGVYVVTVDPGVKVDGTPGEGGDGGHHRAADRRGRRSGARVEHLGHRRGRSARRCSPSWSTSSARSTRWSTSPASAAPPGSRTARRTTGARC